MEPAIEFYGAPHETRYHIMTHGNELVFQRVTACLRKPVTRFGLPSGRHVELLGFHLEPGWAVGSEAPRLVIEDVVRRLYPNERPVFVGDVRPDGPAYLCVANLYSDTPVGRDGVGNYSVLLVCGLVADIDRGVRAIVSELLSQVDWEASAQDDMMW